MSEPVLNPDKPHEPFNEKPAQKPEGDDSNPSPSKKARLQVNDDAAKQAQPHDAPKGPETHEFELAALLTLGNRISDAAILCIAAHDKFVRAQDKCHKLQREYDERLAKLDESQFAHETHRSMLRLMKLKK